jgi:hypothetical protein
MLENPLLELKFLSCLLPGVTLNYFLGLDLIIRTSLQGLFGVFRLSFVCRCRLIEDKSAVCGFGLDKGFWPETDDFHWRFTFSDLGPSGYLCSFAASLLRYLLAINKVSAFTFVGDSELPCQVPRSFPRVQLFLYDAFNVSLYCCLTDSLTFSDYNICLWYSFAVV